MKSATNRFLRHLRENARVGGALPQNAPDDDVGLVRILCREPAGARGITEIGEGDCRSILDVSGRLFHSPTRCSREIAEELGLDLGQLTGIYRLIRDIPAIQDALTFASPRRRRISFLRKELLPENLPTLHAMFNGEVCWPNHIEFHPALRCNLRCRACPNCQADDNGDWYFLGYPDIGAPLNGDRLRMIADLFLERGVRNFSFGGGGEPTLSEHTLGGILHLRHQSDRAEISLYTNGIFPASWGTGEFRSLAASLNKVRFSIDAANAQEWSRYKGRPAELFETLWGNIQGLVRAGKEEEGSTRIGASCLVSDLTCNDVRVFLDRARDIGLDFCDIKAVETCFGEKDEFRAQNQSIRDSFVELMSRVGEGYYSPMDVVVDDSLLQDEQEQAALALEPPPSRCWIAIRGRMLTAGPYGELYPCSDAANPGARERHNNKLVGHLTDFSSPEALEEEFASLWADSLPRRHALSKEGCSYCVPSHNNYNCAVDKLYQDWLFGIRPEDQPFSGERDHYLASRSA